MIRRNHRCRVRLRPSPQTSSAAAILTASDEDAAAASADEVVISPSIRPAPTAGIPLMFRQFSRLLPSLRVNFVFIEASSGQMVLP